MRFCSANVPWPGWFQSAHSRNCPICVTKARPCFNSQIVPLTEPSKEKAPGRAAGCRTGCGSRSVAVRGPLLTRPLWVAAGPLRHCVMMILMFLVMVMMMMMGMMMTTMVTMVMGGGGRASRWLSEPREWL